MKTKTVRKTSQTVLHEADEDQIGLENQSNWYS